MAGTYDQSKYAFVDIETTGLDPNRHQVWEAAFIVDGAEHVFQLSPPNRAGFTCDPVSLRFNRMAERYAEDETTNRAWLAGWMRSTLAGRHLVGANPTFDLRFLARIVRGEEPWHYRPICVESMAMAHAGRYVRGLQGSAEALDVAYDADQHHSALYDAQLAKAVFEAIMGQPAEATS